MRANQGLHAAALALLLVTGTAQAQNAPPLRGTLLGADAGDIACYLRIRDEAGSTRTWMASFEMCEQAEAVMGRRVTLVWRPGQVLHPSCQGNMDCGRSLHVMLVERMTPR